MRRWAALTSFLLATACSPDKFSTGGDMTGASDSGVADSAPEDADTAAGGTPTWWRLGASLAISEAGEPFGDSAELRVEVLDDVELALCAEATPITALAASVKTPDTTVYTWWSVTSEDLSEDCARLDPLADVELYLGIGALHPDIRAGLDTMGLADVADSLNGAYASLDGGSTVYVFGVAGTSAAYEGERQASPAGPLTAGVWEIRPLYAFGYSGR